jgi:hypothetical protein
MTKSARTDGDAPDIEPVEPSHTKTPKFRRSSGNSEIVKGAKRDASLRVNRQAAERLDDSDNVSPPPSLARFLNGEGSVLRQP